MRSNLFSEGGLGETTAHNINKRGRTEHNKTETNLRTEKMTIQENMLT